MSYKNVALGYWLHAPINRLGITQLHREFPTYFTDCPDWTDLRSLNISFILNQFWTKLDKFVDLYNSLVCSSLSIQRFRTGEKNRSF